jgi:methylmalonyl-CoA mutase C-terminal domain/subunit
VTIAPAAPNAASAAAPSIHEAARQPVAGSRVLVAKVGLDGHDRGVKVVGRILRDAGFEVIYTGLQQTPEMVVAAARDEDVDLIGLSLLSGAHMTLVPRLLDELHRQGLDTPLVVGGIIPAADGAALQELGVSAVLTPGASTLEIIDAVTRAIEEYGLGQDQASSTGR